MLFRLLILNLLQSHVCTSFPLKCPEPAQWSIRSRGLCSDPSKYSCLKNDLIKGYSENCSVFDYLQPGWKHVLRGGLDADVCSSKRYQPWPINFFSNVSTNCFFLKSTCNEEGQFVYGKGNRNTDTTCSCDHGRGFAFITKPRNSCFCVPSEEDCSCYLKKCPNSTYNLSSDFKCIHVSENVSITQCNTTIQRRMNRERNESNPEFTLINSVLAENSVIYDQWKMLGRNTLATVLFGFIFVSCIGALTNELLDRYHRKVYFISEPPSDIRLIEGQNISIKYKLSRNIPIKFKKNGMFIAETTNIRKMVNGRWKKIKITHVTPDDEGEYFLEMAGMKSEVTRLIVQPMFTSKIDPQICIEGAQMQLTCSVYADDINVKWYKEGREIHNCRNILITRNENQRKLTVMNVSVSALETYSVKAENVQIDVSVTVKAFFRRRLENVTIMEGLDTKLECETEDKNCSVQWFKGENAIINPSKQMKISKRNGVHTLTISQTSLEHHGTYKIESKGISSIAVLDVKEMPETVKQMSVHDRNQFLKAAKHGTRKRYYIRIMIVGENSVGKTCLLRRLLKENIDDVQSTDGINIEKRKCQIDIETGEWYFPTTGNDNYSFWSDQSERFGDCGFWDFAGQKEFYATHQTFLCTNAVYLLVVDISKDLSNKTYNDMIDKEFNCIGEYIDFWLDNIHCYSVNDNNTSSKHTKDDLINPPVIIVGTGIDKVPLLERIDTTKRFEIYLSKILSTNPKRRHLRNLHYLSNTNPSDDGQEFEKLRGDIFHEAQRLTNWGDNLPTRWIVLEKEIHRKLNEKVISYADTTCLAITCSFPDDKQATTELDSFLKYEHDIGNIIFFDDLKSFIILDPEWLVNVFKCFVSHQYKPQTIGMLEWSVLEETGKLLDNLIVKLLEKVPRLNLTKHKNYVLKIMEKFDIIVRPINDHVNTDFYMPCMIKPVPFQDIFRRSETKDCKRTSWFYLEFNFLPPSYFNHILVSFVKSYKLLIEEDERLSVYRNFGIFLLNPSGSQILYICLSKNTIAMQVRQFNSSAHACYSSVKDKLIDLVHSMKVRYRINITYEKKFKCSKGSYRDNRGRINYATVLNNSEYHCPEHDVMQSSQEIYSSWLTDEEVENERKNKLWKKCYHCANTSVYKCFDCINLLCTDCSRIHDEKKSHSNHTVQPITDCYILNFKFSLEDKLSYISDIICLLNGFLVATMYVMQGNAKKILTFSVKGKQQQFIPLNEDQFRIAVVDKNTVVLTLKKTSINPSVAIYDIQQRQVIQYVNNEIIGKDPHSPFIYIDNQLFVAADSGIIVMDMSGNIKRCFKLGFTSYDLCYDVNSQRIYCIDKDNNELICIDRDGNKIFTFTDPNMNNAHRLNIDNDGNVLVLCTKTENSGCVFKVDSNGKTSDVVITNIKLSRSNLDSCICFHRSTNSVVIGIKDTVYIYKNGADV